MEVTSRFHEFGIGLKRLGMIEKVLHGNATLEDFIPCAFDRLA